MKKPMDKPVKRSKRSAQRQTYGLMSALLILAVGIVFGSILSQSFTLLIAFVLTIVVSALALNTKKIIKELKKGKDKLSVYGDRLFFNTTRLVIVGVLLTLLSSSIPLTPIMVVFYIIVGCILVAAIIGSVWLLFTKETLAKKLAAILYILVLPPWAAAVAFYIILSNSQIGFLG